MSGSRSKRALGHVMTMIVESAAFYSLLLVASAILNMIVSVTVNRSLSEHVFPAVLYTEVILNIVAVCVQNDR